jgi:hypothetical protein
MSGEHAKFNLLHRGAPLIGALGRSAAEKRSQIQTQRRKDKADDNKQFNQQKRNRWRNRCNSVPPGDRRTRDYCHNGPTG